MVENNPVEEAIKKEILRIITSSKNPPVIYGGIAARMKRNQYGLDKALLKQLVAEGKITASNKGYSLVIKKKAGRPKGNTNK